MSFPANVREEEEEEADSHIHVSIINDTGVDIAKPPNHPENAALHPSPSPQQQQQPLPAATPSTSINVAPPKSKGQLACDGFFHYFGHLHSTGQPSAFNTATVRATLGISPKILSNILTSLSTLGIVGKTTKVGQWLFMGFDDLPQRLTQILQETTDSSDRTCYSAARHMIRVVARSPGPVSLVHVINTFLGLPLDRTVATRDMNREEYTLHEACYRVGLVMCSLGLFDSLYGKWIGRSTPILYVWAYPWHPGDSHAPPELHWAPLSRLPAPPLDGNAAAARWAASPPSRVGSKSKSAPKASSSNKNKLNEQGDDDDDDDDGSTSSSSSSEENSEDEYSSTGSDEDSSSYTSSSGDDSSGSWYTASNQEYSEGEEDDAYINFDMETWIRKGLEDKSDLTYEEVKTTIYYSAYASGVPFKDGVPTTKAFLKFIHGNDDYIQTEMGIDTSPNAEKSVDDQIEEAFVNLHLEEYRVFQREFERAMTGDFSTSVLFNMLVAGQPDPDICFELHEPPAECPRSTLPSGFGGTMWMRQYFQYFIYKRREQMYQRLYEMQTRIVRPDGTINMAGAREMYQNMKQILPESLEDLPDDILTILRSSFQDLRTIFEREEGPLAPDESDTKTKEIFEVFGAHHLAMWFPTGPFVSKDRYVQPSLPLPEGMTYDKARLQAFIVSCKEWSFKIWCAYKCDETDWIETLMGEDWRSMVCKYDDEKDTDGGDSGGGGANAACDYNSGIFGMHRSPPAIFNRREVIAIEGHRSVQDQVDIWDTTVEVNEKYPGIMQDSARLFRKYMVLYYSPVLQLDPFDCPLKVDIKAGEDAEKAFQRVMVLREALEVRAEKRRKKEEEGKGE
jgi:hypothetical protein